MPPALDQLIAPVADRTRIAGSLARLSAGRDPRTSVLRRALSGTLLGRLDAGEREWVARIERRRAALLAERAVTGPPFDPGAESGATNGSAPLGVASRMMSLAPVWCLLLMRLIRELGARSCLELGTGFGISAAYQAAALRLNGGGRLTTLEGSAAWAREASTTLEQLGLTEVRLPVGPIAESLAREAEALAPLDFVFVDAEHRAEPTIAYFDRLLPSLAEGAVVVFDDVHWPEMRAAHAEIARRPRVARSLSIGRIGLTAISAT